MIVLRQFTDDDGSLTDTESGLGSLCSTHVCFLGSSDRLAREGALELVPRHWRSERRVGILAHQ